MTTDKVTFNQDVLDYLQSERKLAPEGIEAIIEDYLKWRTEHNLLHATPEVADVSLKDIDAVLARHDMNYPQGETWEDFKGRTAQKALQEEDALNPFMPLWDAKTEDRTNVWFGDCSVAGSGDNPVVPDELRGGIDKALRKYAPVLAANMRELVGSVPTKSTYAYEDTVTAMLQVPQLYVSSIGSTDNTTWRWGKALCCLGSIGLEAVRRFANTLLDEEGWDHYASLDDHELRLEILEAHSLHGYPLALGRTDYCALANLYKMDADGGSLKAPDWMNFMGGLHLCKYVRFMPKIPTGGPGLFVAYKGRYATIPVPPEGVAQPLSAPVNKNVAKLLAATLRLPCAFGRMTNVSSLQKANDRILDAYHPSHFSRLRTLDLRPDLTTAPSTVLSQSHRLTENLDWIDPGIAVHNVAKIDYDTGKVDTRYVVRGPDTLTYQWPHKIVEEDEIVKWRSLLPAEVPALRPSDVISTFIKNINCLGCPEGWAALMDTAIVTDLCRKIVGGTQVGNLLAEEFIFMAIYPTGYTLDDTTNQGKTNTMRIIARSLVPDLPVSSMSRSSSAPAQRSIAEIIQLYGTAALTEYVMPKSNDHFLNKEGTQGALTGALMNPGRALENSPGFKLRHHLFAEAKVSALPPDMRNRQLATFLDALTDETRLSEETLAIVMSGQASTLLRLCTLRWMHENNLIERIRETSLRGNAEWRYNGHLTVAYIVCETVGTPTEKIREYFQLAEEQCTAQLESADDHGLTDELGLLPGFSIEFFWNQCGDFTMESLYMNQRTEYLKVGDVVRALIEDGNRRQFESTIRSFGKREQAVIAGFTSEMKKKGELVRGEWRMTAVTKGDSDVMDASGHKRGYVILEKDGKRMHPSYKTEKKQEK